MSSHRARLATQRRTQRVAASLLLEGHQTKRDGAIENDWLIVDDFQSVVVSFALVAAATGLFIYLRLNPLLLRVACDLCVLKVTE